MAEDEIHLDDDDPMPGNRIVPPKPVKPVQQRPQAQPPAQAQQAQQAQQTPGGQPKKKKFDRRVDLYFSEKDFLFIREFSTERGQGFGKTVLQAIELLRSTTEKEKAFEERRKQGEGQK